jgi:hypothetical protein
MHQSTYKISNIKLYFLLAVFILPVIFSSVLFHYHDYFHFKTKNHGNLVNPPINADYLYTASQQKKWRIVYINGGTCDPACADISKQLTQVKKALGKDEPRVDVLLLKGNAYYEPLTIAFQQHTKNNFNVKNKIYLVDPQGNLFMYYESNTNPMDVLKDLKHILGVSQIG